MGEGSAQPAQGAKCRAVIALRPGRGSEPAAEQAGGERRGHEAAPAHSSRVSTLSEVEAVGAMAVACLPQCCQGFSGCCVEESLGRGCTESGESDCGQGHGRGGGAKWGCSGVGLSRVHSQMIAMARVGPG